MTREVLRSGALLVAAFALSACATTMAEVPTSDNNVLVVRGYGSRSMVAQKCLSADTIKQLINSDIPASAAGKPCYWVALVSSDSTDISRAVASFIRAKTEFDDKVARLAAPAAPDPSEQKRIAPDKAAAIDTANSLLAAAITEDSQALVNKTNKLATDEKVSVKEQLRKIRAGVTDPIIQNKLDTVLTSQ